MSRAPRILCVGALTQDTIFRLEQLPRGAGKFIPAEAVQNAAGMASSAATAARRQGAVVSLWASVGDDMLGTELTAELTAEGIDCSGVRRVAGARSAIATILVDAAGERMIVPFYDPRATTPPDALPFDLSGFDAVLTDVRWPGAAALALQGAKKAGIPAILDIDVAARPILEDLLPHATHIVASEPAAAILCGEVAVEEAVSMLHARTGVFVAITAGGAGTYWRDEATGAIRHTPAPKITPVDTLAAGDVFHGSFAVGLAEGWDMERTIRFASAAAALKCLKFGGRLGAPTRTETTAMLEGQPV
ncbi:PfkB family carbohydrate kinase [Kaistia granuli]|uniref:PfkB family carbohydrate kinase n=1 Tax=Kaistia granuli TaxID=363259 RepID=UPI000364F2CC|nr:PfkB family carbohydrate kinase [Kaistia granuli]